MPAAAKPDVQTAWAAVMGEVREVAKTGRNTQQNYNFRGIDAVMNAVGPAFRSHGVSCVPIACGIVTDHQYQTKHGTAMRGVTVNVTFRVFGPAGDSFDGQALGEAADSGDKAIPKAHSVAYRTFLLQALCLPTDDPDPDSESHERVAPPQAQPTEAKPETKFEQPTGPRGAKGETASEEQADQLMGLISGLIAAEKITAEQITSAAGIAEITVATLGTLPKAKAEELIGRLERYKANAAEANGS